jgi:hypothetical protein
MNVGVVDEGAENLCKASIGLYCLLSGSTETLQEKAIKDPKKALAESIFKIRLN